MPRVLTAVLVVVVCSGGCSTYDHRYVYEPRPADVEAVAGDGMPVHVLVTVLGLRRPDKSLGVAESMDLRLRLENTGDEPVTFDPRTLSLYAADLTRFAEPVVDPADAIELASGATAMVEASFALPTGRSTAELDLSGLRLRWKLDTPAGPVSASCGFVQRPNAYYDRYPNRIGVGYQRWDC